MDYRILGRLEVCVGDRTVDLGGEKQRALLAILLLHANEPVSVDRLIEGVWGELLPPTALKTLQGYVSRLRKALDDGEHESPGSTNGVLVTRGRGYLLRVEPGELDLDRFRGLVEEGRAALAARDPERAARILRSGLSLWRGPALADFAYDEFAQPAIGQAEELRLGALEERVEADLALGLHGDFVGELAALVERYPLRERVRAQLMLALYRSGRQAEALQVYQEYRRALSEQLGLETSPGLRQLETSILTRDPSLELQVNKPSASAPVTGASGRWWVSRRRRGPRLVLAGSVVIAGALVALVAVLSGGGATSLSVIAADSVGAISAVRGAIAAQVPVGSSPTRLAAGDGSVWLTSTNSNTVSRVDSATHAVVQTIPVDSTPGGIAVGAGAVWVANNLAGSVSRIDPTAGKVVQTTAVGNAPSGVAVGFGSVWVTNASDGTLSRIDALTGAVVKTIALGGGATDLAVGLGAVWVTDETNGRVVRVDPHSDQVTQAINVGTGPSAIAAGAGSVWVANSLDGTVSRIDPQTNSVAATILVGDGPDAIAVGAGGVWVANEFGGTVSRIDAASDTVTHTTGLGNPPQGLAIAGGVVWVGVGAQAVTSHRGGTLTVLSHGPFGSLDPASPQAGLPSGLTVLITNDGLTAFKRVGGSAGVQVVPDLAVSLPTPIDSGLTYTFQLRSGIRYSTGQTVRAADFRHALERLFELNPALGAAEYRDIVGAAACLAHPVRCDLSRGIVADDAANTVTFHLVAPDPEFLDRLALSWAVAVPAGTPDRDLGTHPLPATGPYQIVSDTPHAVRLIRNVYFHEWSRAARPDGYPDRIVWRIGGSVESAVTAVERGAADYTLDPPPPDRLRELRTRFASQLNVNPNAVTDTLSLNTRLAPFDDLRVRRALNYAVDRAKIASLLGADSHPTCQVLPPYAPGYKPYCPYTLDPSPAGVWHAPDLTKARALIAASGTRGAAITIWSQPAVYIADYNPVGRYLVSLLDRLGYRAKLKTIAAGDPSYNPSDSRQKVQAALGVYYPLYLAASEFLGPRWVSCQSFVPDSPANLNLSEFCDPRFDATVRSALAAESANSPDATQLWAKADRQFTDQAPLVDLVTPSSFDFVSRRVGDYEYNPVQGALLDQLWVR